MTEEEIKRIVDDERTEQLTTQLCRHWEVATQRLEALVKDLADGMDICVEAEVYAAVMRMQSAVMALTELNNKPCAFLFSEYLDRISKTVSNASIRQSVMTMFKRLLTEQSTKGGRHDSFFELVIRMMVQHAALPKEKQDVIMEKVSPMQHVFALFAQYLKPEDLMMVASLIQEINAESDADDQEEIVGHVMAMRQAMDDLASKMDESRLHLLMCLVLLVLLPGLMVSMMQQSRTDSKVMADLFEKVLMRVRESNEWWEYWKDRRETFKVVNDDLSWKEIMKVERSKEREELGKVPGGLFAKWTTDRKAFEAELMDAGLSDDDLRHFIFHLATLAEIARELNPTSKFGDEQLVNNDLQRVGEAVLTAANKLGDLVAKPWEDQYDAMWQELIQNETIFAHLKVTRKSPHNNLFTARFFCHLVGEMKKSKVFGSHSDHDLAEKLTDKRHFGTYRKNIQEGMGKDSVKTRKAFTAIYQKYNALAHPKN